MQEGCEQEEADCSDTNCVHEEEDLQGEEAEGSEYARVRGGYGYASLCLDMKAWCLGCIKPWVALLEDDEHFWAIRACATGYDVCTNMHVLLLIYVLHPFVCSPSAR
jgi:hypothetical protein